MVEAASRLACWACWLRHDGLLSSALGSRNGAEEGESRERTERVEREGRERGFGPGLT
jgi:hypothetical protein